MKTLILNGSPRKQGDTAKIISLAKKEELILPVGREGEYLSKIECPCCRTLVKMETVELSHEHMVQDTNPYIYKGGK